MKSLPYPPPYQDTPTLAAHLSVHENTIAPMVRAGQLPPANRVGLWKWDEVVEYLNSFVYFVQVHEFIKIGFSRDFKKRLGSLQSANPIPIRVLKVVVGSEQTESELHRRFSHLRTTGEWFKAETELLEYVDGLKDAGVDV